MAPPGAVLSLPLPHSDLNHPRRDPPDRITRGRLVLTCALAACTSGFAHAGPAQVDAARHLQSNATEHLSNAASAREQRDWPRALHHYAEVLATSPEHPEALRETAITLQQMGASGEAWRRYRARPDLFSGAEALGFELDQLARRINHAELEPDPQRRAEAVAAVLADMEALAPIAASDRGASLRLRFDRLLALHLAGQHVEVTAEATALHEESIALPAWLRLPVADSWMAQREPGPAAELLQQVLAEDSGQERATVLLAYAWLELERHDEARALLRDWLDVHPPWRSDGQPEWARAGVELNTGLIDSFSEQLAPAQARLHALSGMAPLDAGLLQARAGIERRRGQPESALVSAQRARVEAPAAVLPRVAEIEALLDLDRVAEARSALDALLDLHPAHRQTDGVQQRWARRQGPQWGVEAVRADSSALDRPGPALGPGGSGEFRALTRWDGPLLRDEWRLGAGLRWHWADFRGERVERQQAAVTASWRQDRQALRIEAGRSFDDGVRETPIGLSYDYRHDDRWRGSAAVWRHAPFASLQARAAGLRADALQLGASYSPDERSRSALSLEQLRYEDGNRRSSAYLSHQQQLQAGPRGEWRGRLGAGVGHASRMDAPYFNPRRDASLDAGLRLDRVLWRDYDSAWRLRIDVDASRVWQDGFGAHWRPAVEITPRWLPAAGREYSLGLRWSRPVYDGQREQHWALVLRLGGGE